MNQKFVFVLDNSRVHLGLKLQNLIEEYSIFVIYIPPYSPYLNSVEYSFNYLKKKTKKNSIHYSVYYFILIYSI